MKKIGVVRGDGVGSEVVEEGLRMLRHVAERTGFDYETIEYPWGADHYVETGETMPDSVLSEYRELDAILLGAIGDPRVETGLLERAIIGGIRWKLDMYINLRPIKLYHADLCPLKDKQPEDVDMVFVRENTESLYCQIHGVFKQGTPDEITTQEMVNTRKGVERAVRYAFELAHKRPRRKLTLVDKANALRSQDLWTRVFAEVGQEFPDVETDHAYIDAACMWMVKNPEWFDVAVVDNMFGDIIPDLGAIIQGGLGVAASGNIHPGRVSMFEPIHGSAPKYRGKGVACPIATIAAVGMMLDFLGNADGAARIDGAIGRALGERRIPSLSADSGLKTSEYTDILIELTQGRA
jgi:3-isopropylmalate dehydrogenase